MPTKPKPKSKTKVPDLSRRLHAAARALAADGRSEAAVCRSGAREIINLKRHLEELTAVAKQVINAIDAEMKPLKDETHGRAMARIVGVLEMANDRARYFGLGIDWRTDRKDRTTKDNDPGKGD